ncbi:hypothetical protein MJN47_29685, partial [Salmonella enterica subsp. enterica serovar Lubbock]|nr:hypothetical protein [Salmonella enterica subsp. enterica serovar Lubbock]
GEMYQPQNFLPQASKTFASAPGQLPRDVVSVPRRKGPLRGNPHIALLSVIVLWSEIHSAFGFLENISLWDVTSTVQGVESLEPIT